MYNKIYELIKEYNTIIIHRHEKPDGDALGSQLGLKLAILETFPEKEVFVVGDTTEYLNFLGIMDEIEDTKYHNALVIVLDSGAEYLISDKRFSMGKVVVKIDHHIPQGKYGDIALVNTKYESCAGLVTHFIKKTKMKLNSEAANLLFTGIVTDSGRFRYDSTTSKTFEICSKLFGYGIDINEVYNNLYIEDLETVKLRAEFVSKFLLTEKNVAYIKTTKEEVKKLNVDIFTISRGMVNTMSGIRGIDIWANFTEDEESGGVICEL